MFPLSTHTHQITSSAKLFFYDLIIPQTPCHHSATKNLTLGLLLTPTMYEQKHCHYFTYVINYMLTRLDQESSTLATHDKAIAAYLLEELKCPSILKELREKRRM